MSRRAPRLMLYSHNAVGLGHVMRGLMVARAALEAGLAAALVTGCRFLDDLGPLPPGLELQRLEPVRLAGGLPVGLTDGDPGVLARRGKHIARFVRDWAPDAVLVDHVPLGLGGELLEALSQPTAARWFWGMRDVVQAPGGDPPPPPGNPRLKKALAAYHGVIAYTDPDWLDGPAFYRRYPLPGHIDYVGVLAEAMPPTPPTPGLVALLAGGGTGGTHLFSLAAQALALLPPEARLRVVIGPFGQAWEPPPELAGRVEVWPRGTVQQAAAGAALVICRAGYNTAYAAVAGEQPVILAPLVNEGREQHYRAQRLAELDRVWFLDDQAPKAAGELARLMDQGLAAGHGPRSLPFRLGGAARAARVLAESATGEQP